MQQDKTCATCAASPRRTNCLGPQGRPPGHPTSKPAGIVTDVHLLPTANEVSWDAVWWWSRPDGALQVQPSSRRAAKAQAMVGVRSPLSSALTIIIDPQVPRTDEVLSTPRAPKRTAV